MTPFIWASVMGPTSGKCRRVRFQDSTTRAAASQRVPSKSKRMPSFCTVSPPYLPKSKRSCGL